jgi:hypothetical protein
LETFKVLHIALSGWLAFFSASTKP